jgi:L-asparaginase
MLPRVVLIGTGGTIASRFDPKLGRTVASQRAQDLLAQVPQLAEIADVEVDDFATVPSFDMPSTFAFQLAGRINAQLARGEVAGVVVTHGTDTMEESCYLVREAVAQGVPVVIASGCPSGRVEPIYGKGGGKDLADAGAIFAGDLKGPKARLLLMVLLGLPDFRGRVAEIFAEVAP